MGKKSGAAAPPPPDYTGAAQQTAAGNLDMAKYQTEANRINQYTPYGSLTYNKDANGNWSQTESYDPRIQKALDSQIGVQQGLSDQANAMLGTVQNSYNQPFNAPNWQDYRSGLGGVDTTRLANAGQFGSNAQVQGSLGDTGQVNGNLGQFMNGVSSVDQSGQPAMGNFRSNSRVDTNPMAWLSSSQPLNQSFGRTTADGSNVNMNAPEFTNARQDEYSKAAYDSQMGLLRGDLDSQEERQNNRLALQGLAPGSEASDNALSSFYDGRSRQLNALASQSVLTGNQMSNNDYQSQLAGFNAGNAAAGQQFNQNITGFNTNLNAGQAENTARGQQFAQALQAFQSGNDAQAQKFSQDSNTFTNNMQARSLNNQLQQSRNQAQQQAYDQSLSNFNATNAAQQQGFNQALQSGQFNNSAAAQQFAQDQASYSTNLQGQQFNAGLQQQYNQAQQQAYAQALQNYGTDWQQAQTLRNMPLNELNALLNGQQVQNPTFENYALQQYVGGADQLGAAQLQGQYATNVYNQQQANAGSQLGAIGGLAGSIFGAAGSAGGFSNLFSDRRLKKNVEKVGETPGGSNVYTWDWNKKAEEIGAANQPSFGVIAQEHPEATTKGKRGYLMVDYKKVA